MTVEQINNESLLLKPNWKRDISNICLLLGLYLLQGVIIGITVSIPILLQTYGSTWNEQAIYSFAFWPFNLKLLWAPIIDSVFIKRFGRRKTWLIPIQLLTGVTLIILSFYIMSFLIERKILILTVIFFCLIFLIASQDVCVDGWALNLLEKANLGWASTCQTVGQTMGLFLGHTVFLTLESKGFSNQYIRKILLLPEQSYGIVSFPTFFLLSGMTFIIVTSLIAIFKHEIEDKINSKNIIETYLVTLKLFKKSCIRELTFILLTFQIGFAATNSMTSLKLIQNGVTKESLIMIGVPLIFVKLLVPFSVSHSTAGPKPLNTFIYSYIPRLVACILVAIFVYVTSLFQILNSKSFHWYYYLIAIILLGINEALVYAMIVSLVSFFANVSDPKIGGTYMTLLNTIVNLGTNLTSTSMLYLATWLTRKSCTVQNLTCNRLEDEKQCTSLNGKCQIKIDAYYIQAAFCIVLGFLWFIWKYRSLNKLQVVPLHEWHIKFDSNPSPTEISLENDTTGIAIISRL
ncbi:unnamed protein product [Didymodactylos carnosus]|uniref:Acetyl-coenzyme A transporter 1 n=2 Tax=Didymodactylos carnosus TaxID=1234261 RepID=A0A8S2F843_9BILA|nr:unnamed protein product [Didymodactylos carnosus]CAF4170549.1 unnamed protein product [Didymodactylos carnosus]